MRFFAFLHFCGCYNFLFFLFCGCCFLFFILFLLPLASFSLPVIHFFLLGIWLQTDCLCLFKSHPLLGPYKLRGEISFVFLLFFAHHFIFSPFFCLGQRSKFILIYILWKKVYARLLCFCLSFGVCVCVWFHSNFVVFARNFDLILESFWLVTSLGIWVL